MIQFFLSTSAAEVPSNFSHRRLARWSFVFRCATVGADQPLAAIVIFGFHRPKAERAFGGFGQGSLKVAPSTGDNKATLSYTQLKQSNAPGWKERSHVANATTSRFRGSFTRFSNRRLVGTT